MSPELTLFIIDNLLSIFIFLIASVPSVFALLMTFKSTRSEVAQYIDRRVSRGLSSDERDKLSDIFDVLSGTSSAWEVSRQYCYRIILYSMVLIIYKMFISLLNKTFFSSILSCGNGCLAIVSIYKSIIPATLFSLVLIIITLIICFLLSFLLYEILSIVRYLYNTVILCNDSCRGGNQFHLRCQKILQNLNSRRSGSNAP
jgi:hypothetical protein